VRRAAVLLALLLGCSATAPSEPSWASVSATVEVVGEDTYLSFQPVAVTQIRLEGASPKEKDVEAYGVRGPIEKFDVAEGVIRFKEPTSVAEVILLGTKAPKIRVSIPAAERPDPRAKVPDAKTLEELGKFNVTFYWVESEADYEEEPADTPLLDDEGKELGRFPKTFVERVRVEGTGKLRDGRVINTSGKEGRFAVVRCPNGLGVEEYHLLPFRSVACDKGVVPIGTELYIPAAVGAKLPDGTVHDGHFWTHDVGGGIQGKHLDFFTGAGDQSELLEKAGLKNLEETKVYRVR